MSTIKIETLTPVHVGSGNLLYNNTDFVSEKIDGEPHLVVISEEKIWKLLGEQHLDNWLQAIAERKNLKEFLKVFIPEAKSKDYGKRRIPLFAELKQNDTLKEVIHNGMGLPYIPGSSIKGAIRTAVLASVVNTIHDKENTIRESKNEKSFVSAKKIEMRTFGSDPNNDAFRFIQVGDAYFEKECEIATRLVNLNITHKDQLMDTSKPQIVEAIGTEAESTFQLNVAINHYNFAKSSAKQLGKLPIQSISDLFKMINQHTKILVNDEIEYWNDINKVGADDYINEMQKIMNKIDSCEQGKSCVLRIGHASGWRFITGAWTETLTNFKEVVVPASRPRNNTYMEYDFPKTRRLDEESFILGFVKLTVES
jgi:CRISPR type III-A-associated RAMP protein Csm5